jgi:L,D-peptidoglycan transpeptidase YkuD (ErfK/YbiS/YcfS/YnhG family)
MPLSLTVYPKEDTFEATINGQYYRCAVGKKGLISGADKAEGDGCTPVGVFPLRRLFYRPDIYAPDQIKTELHLVPMENHHGWCDDPTHPAYNTLVDVRALNTCVSHEKLWRDHVYNLVIEVGYNDDSIVPWKGSAIFIHLARANYTGTEGCIAFSESDLMRIISHLSPSSMLNIEKKGG